VESTITTFQNMNAEVLYYPSDQSFPLVDKLQGWIWEVGSWIHDVMGSFLV